MSDPTVRRVENAARPAPAVNFDGHVEMEPILEAGGFRQNRVHFHNGGRTHWHLHTGNQVLYFVAGDGMVEDEDGTTILTTAGDIVHVDPGTKHRHGAQEGHSATHIAITEGDSVWD